MTRNSQSGVESRGPWKILFQRLLKNRVALSGAAVLLVLYVSCLFAGLISPYDPTENDDENLRVRLYGPMLLGGYHMKVHATHVFEDEDGDEVEVSEYEREWRNFDGGIHFRDQDGNFTLRPHVHPLREYYSYDEYGEAESMVGLDTSVSLPLELFVQSDQDHELFSLFGAWPVRGRTHLFGVTVPEDVRLGPQRFARVFLLGSDGKGRDLFTRILFGGQISMSVGLVGIIISMVIGCLVGGISGYYGGWLDFVLMRFVELLMAIPGLYLILTLRYTIPKELTSRQTYLMIVAILALASWASISRIIRGMVLSLRENEYTIAARSLGASDFRIIVRHIIPNTASFVIVTATLTIPYYILGEAGLSFLGLGITEPDTSWGLLLKDAQNSSVLKYSPWLVLPGFAIFLAVLAYNFLGDGLRDAADPRAVISSNLPPKVKA